MVTPERRRTMTRRGLLRGAGAAVIAGPVPAPFVSRAFAYAQLRIVQSHHCIPGYDDWIDALARDWGARNGIDVTIDHLSRQELMARAAAEASAQSGHDIFGFAGDGEPHRYATQLLDLTPLVNDVVRKYGAVGPLGSSIAYRVKSGTWIAFPDFYGARPGLYRKDLWDEIGMQPDSWEKLRAGGAKLRAKGFPIGLALGRSDRLSTVWHGVLWSFGASLTDATGARFIFDSAQAVEAVKYVRALAREAMDPATLASDASNVGALLAARRVSWIAGPLSVYRMIQKTTPERGTGIGVWKAPAGPVRRLIVGAPRAYGVWRFAQNRDAAIAFLRYYADRWSDGFTVSTGYNCPFFPGMLPRPTPILSFDPTSEPPEKLEVLETADDWHAFDGYPGPGSAAADAVADQYVLCDMMARAATGDATPEDAVDAASKAIADIYRKLAS